MCITQEQHCPLHKSPGTSELSLLQSSCSKCRWKIQMCLWDFYHPRTNKRFCSANRWGCQRERMNFLHAVKSVRAWGRASVRHLLVVGTAKTNTLPDSDSKELRLLLRKGEAEYNSYKIKYFWPTNFSFKRETDLENLNCFCSANEEHLKLIRDEDKLIF